MWPWALGSAALGGLTAYQQSGGDLGKTLAGATIAGGLGLAVPGVSRMAGQALQNTGILAPIAAGATKALGKVGLAGKLGLPTAVSEAALRTGAGVLGRGVVGGMAVPAIAANITGSVGNGPGGIPGQVISGTTGLGVNSGIPGIDPYNLGPYNPDPALSPDIAAKNRNLSWYDVAGPLGQLNKGRVASMLESNTATRNMVQQGRAAQALISQAEKDQMARQMAAAQIRSNIAINANAIAGGMESARNMAQDTNRGLIAALGAQYNYG
jgi:hypothetical protein